MPLSTRGGLPWTAQLAPTSSSPRETPLKVGGPTVGQEEEEELEPGRRACPDSLSSGSSDRLGGSAAQGWGVGRGWAAYASSRCEVVGSPLQGQPESGEIPPQNGTILRKIKSQNVSHHPGCFPPSLHRVGRSQNPRAGSCGLLLPGSASTQPYPPRRGVSLSPRTPAAAHPSTKSPISPGQSSKVSFLRRVL